MLSVQHDDFYDGKHHPYRCEYDEIPCALWVDYASSEEDNLAAIVHWEFRYGDQTLEGLDVDSLKEMILDLKDKSRMIKVVSHDIVVLSWFLADLKNELYPKKARGGKYINLTIEDYFQVQEIESIYSKKWYKLNGNSAIEKLHNFAKFYWIEVASKKSDKAGAKDGKAPDTVAQYIINKMKRKMTIGDKVLVRQYLMPKELSKYEDVMGHVYMGGFCGYNHNYLELDDNTGDWFCDWDETIGDADIKSSYLTRIILSAEFPMTQFVKYPIKDIETALKTKACLVRARYKNLEADIVPFLMKERVIIQNKEEAFVRAGRVISAKEIEVFVTGIDFQLIHQCYTYDDCEILQLFVAEKDRLPLYVREVAQDMYILKESSKDVAERSWNKLCGEIIYGAMGKQYTDEQKQRDYGQLKDEAILSPYWACWVASLSRWALIPQIILINGPKGRGDWCYSDTDCIKFKNPYLHTQQFLDYNEKQQAIVRCYCEDFGLDYEQFKYLGSFCFECKKDKHNPEPYTIDGLRVLTNKTYAQTWIDEDGMKHFKVCCAGSKQSFWSEVKKDFVNTWEYNYTAENIMEVFNNITEVPQIFEEKEQVTTPYDVTINGKTYHLNCGAKLSGIVFRENRIKTFERAEREFNENRELDRQNGYEVR